MALACFIGIYWTACVFIDAFYFSHSDWPKGRAFAVGHILLTLFFATLAMFYWALLIWHVAGIRHSRA